MSVSRVKLFAPEIVDNSAPDDLITVAATPSTLLLVNGRIRFSNVTNSGATIKAWAVPSGGTADDTNVCLPTVSIPANSYLDMDVPQIGAGDKLQGQAGTVNAINAQPIDGSYYFT